MNHQQLRRRVAVPAIIAVAAFTAGVAFAKLDSGGLDWFQSTVLWIQLVASLVGVVLLLYVLGRIDPTRPT